MRQIQTFRKKLIPIIVYSAVLPLIILSVASLVRLKLGMEARYKEQARSNLDKAEKALCITLDKYESILYDMCTDDEIVGIVERINKNQDDLEVNSSKLRRELSHICNRTDGVEGITIFTAGGEMIFYDRIASSSAVSQWISEDLYPDTDEILSYTTDTKPVGTGADQEYLLHINRRLVNYQDINQLLGTVVLSVNEEILGDAVASEGDNHIYISENGIVFGACHSSDIGKEVASLDDKDYYTVSDNYEKTDWVLTEFYSLTMYRDGFAEQIVFELLIACAVIALLIIMVYYLSNPLVKSVNQVVDAMNAVETGDFTVRIPEDASMPLELNRISLGFNEMVERIDVLINQVKTAAVEQKNAELQALEAQIDPHFLYNTLDAINWKAIENGEMEISEMVGALADILRYTVNQAGEETTIRRELYWLRQYVLLQQMKIGREVALKLDVSEELLDIHIHKLLLQPFVENGIKHGFREKEGECRLLIHMELDEKRMHIIIEDNGCGMKSSTLNKLNDENALRGDHMGVDNVRKRLKLYYSDDAYMYFESEEGKFTRVHMFIPT